jgi:hypothetical protein
VEQLPAFDQLQLRFRDPVQRRYEIIRPLLMDDCTAAERAAHTHLHPDTIGKLKRRFEQPGMLGLFPRAGCKFCKSLQPLKVVG